MPGQNQTLQLKLLGDISLERDGSVLKLPASRKTRALLAYLALNRKPHRRDTLCELLWGDNDDPRAALRWSLTKLRALLGDALEAGREAIELSDSGLPTDVEQARALLKPGQDPDPAALEAVEGALNHGYLPSIDCAASPEFELWLESERKALHRLHGEVLLKLQTMAGAGDPTRALHYARKRVGIDPYSTAANLGLLDLLLRHEGRESARQAFEQGRVRLRKSDMDDGDLLLGWRTLTGAAVGKRSDDALTADPAAPELPAKPSLAVLGFQDIGDDGRQVLGRGLTADLISRLSRTAGLFVIARASSTRFTPGAHGFAEIGRWLGVRYLIHGSIQTHGSRVRVNVELVDAERGREVWVESFEHSRNDLFQLQDELVNGIVAAVEPEIERAEYDRARLKPPASLDAWENYHMALWHSFRFTAADTELARHYLKRALKLDPQFSRAHAALSLTHFSRAFLNTGNKPGVEIDLALASAQRSVDLDSRDAMGHWSLGRAQFLLSQHDLSLASLERSLRANPNYAQGHYARGFVSVHSGIATVALPELEAAQRLSPFDPLLFAMISSRAVALALQDNYAESAELAVRATLEANAHFHIYAIAAACLELAGRHEEAKQNMRIAMQRHPGYSRKVFFRSFPYKHEEHHHLLDTALAAAGMPRGK